MPEIKKQDAVYADIHKTHKQFYRKSVYDQRKRLYIIIH